MSENIEDHQEQNKPEYQSVENIVLKKVSEGDIGFDGAIKVFLPSEGELSDEEIERRVRQELENRNWWLQEYWQEKGLPKEQIDIQVGDYKITLYNFGEQLLQQHLEELKRAIEDYSKVDDAKAFAKVKYILLDNERPLNPINGEEFRGYGAGLDSTIKIYPKGRELNDNRIEETPNFEGVSTFEATVIHELSHAMQDTIKDSFMNEWMSKFGWKLLKKPKKLLGGQFTMQETETPERCISNYATANPSEDICESMVAVLRKPGVLDPEKLHLLKDRLLKDSESLPVDMRRKGSDEIELPKIASEVNYKTSKSLILLKGTIKRKITGE